MGKVASLLYTRYLAGQLPLAMVSMDNCSHNGDKLRDAMFAMADGWVKNGCVDESFADYVRNGHLVSFPWTMIDKITPRPDAVVDYTPFFIPMQPKKPPGGAPAPGASAAIFRPTRSNLPHSFIRDMRRRPYRSGSMP